MENIVVYGTAWCPDCKRAKQFFAEHRVQYGWIDIEQDSDAMAYVEELNQGKRIIPTIVFPDGSLLIEPSNAQLADKLGLQTMASETFYDVVIVGGGPTGLTTSIYTAREGLNTLVIEKAGLGGQAGITQVLDNFPGFDEGISGADFARKLGNQARRFGVEVLQAQEVSHVSREGNYLHVGTASGDEIGAHAILIATGSKYRRLEVPGESELIGVNVHFCATCDGAFYKGKEVLVIGGGNSGFEEGLFLTKFATKVTIAVDGRHPSASAILQEKVAERHDMQVLTDYAIKEFKVADNRLAGAVFEDRANHKTVEMKPDGVFVFVGLSPNADFLPPEIARDGRGFVRTADNLMTAMPGVFAAGDVRAGSTKQAAAAVGEGATAALMIREYLKKTA